MKNISNLFFSNVFNVSVNMLVTDHIEPATKHGRDIAQGSAMRVVIHTKPFSRVDQRPPEHPNDMFSKPVFLRLL